MKCVQVCLACVCGCALAHVCVGRGGCEEVVVQVYHRDGSAQFYMLHTEIEVADQTFYLTQSQYTDTRPTSPSTDPITPGAWQGSHWSANF